MRARSLIQALLLAAVASPAAASQATTEGARQLAQSYADYVSRAAIDKGVVSVTPDGDGYVVAWDLQKAMALIDSATGALAMQPFAYRLTPVGDGAWRLEAQSFPSVAFDAPTDQGRFSGMLDLRGFQLDGGYDPVQTDFLRASLAVAAIGSKLDARTDPVERRRHRRGQPRRGIARQERGGGRGRRRGLCPSTKGLTETLVAKPAGDDAPEKIALAVGAASGGISVTGLRAHEIAELWKYAVAHLDDPSTPADALEARFAAALPLWNDFKANLELSDLGAATPLGRATIKTLAEKLGFSGLSDRVRAEFGVSFASLVVEAHAASAWARMLTPASLSLDLQFTGGGFDRARRLALADLSLAEGGVDLSPQTQAEIDAALLAGDPKLTLAPGRLTTPAIDLAFEGGASATGGAASGHFTVSADGLDKTLKALQEIAKTEPDAATAILGVAFIKGLAQTAPDGRLVWKIEIDDGGVTVNGESLPTGK